MSSTPARSFPARWITTNSRRPSPIPADPAASRSTPAIRAARPGDAAFLPAIERSAAQRFATIPALAGLATGDVMTAQAHRACIAECTCWVAQDDTGMIVGFLSARTQHDSLHILELSVRRESQGQGLGRALLHAAMHQVRQSRRTGGLTLTTFRDVAWNAPFYRAMGFVDMDTPPPWLGALLAEEIAGGFPAGSRCAMRWRPGEEIIRK
ncbi:GNAT family N-acetyltransferase [Gluconacetobacter entanii]|uniref:GNAT family N-acetyltransferase n=1 Tax=Gluconacetobacter entanii TaxID=108528 RepID=UPI001FC8F00D|nr:GNAT family N-acetyltransferase [Gluconacetobacter entanii]